MDCSLPGSFAMGFSRQEYWSGLPFPSPRDLSHPGIKSVSFALASRFFISEAPGKPTKDLLCTTSLNPHNCQVRSAVLAAFHRWWNWSPERAILCPEFPSRSGNEWGYDSTPVIFKSPPCPVFWLLPKDSVTDAVHQELLWPCPDLRGEGSLWCLEQCRLDQYLWNKWLQMTLVFSNYQEEGVTSFVLPKQRLGQGHVWWS